MESLTDLASMGRKRLSCLALAPGAHKLVGERLDDVRHDRALAGLNEGFDRHAGDQLHGAQPRDLCVRYSNAGQVKTRPTLLVDRNIGGHLANFPVELRSDALVEGREA